MSSPSLRSPIVLKNNTWASRWWGGLWEPSDSAAGYLARAWITDVPVTLGIVAIFSWLTRSGWPDFSSYSLGRILFAMVLFAPIGETLLMAVIFWLMRFAMKRRGGRAAISALIWAALHSLAAPLWGLQIFWAFLIFSICYVTWEQRSVWRAIAITATLHMLHNAVPAVALIIERFST